MAAWSALIGSISATSTRAPNALRLWQHPFPTSPYPATRHTYTHYQTHTYALQDKSQVYTWVYDIAR